MPSPVSRTSSPRCVVITGQIASGKTTLAELLADRYDYTHIRVRRALLHALGGANWDRERLQREGADLDRRTNGRWLLDVLVEIAEASRLFVVDSGRTRRQVVPVIAYFESAMIYLEASEVTRRKRYHAAMMTDDLKRRTPFAVAMQHDTEREARELRAISDVVVETDDLDPQGVLREAASFLGLLGDS